nr:cation transporter [Nevskia sp.]
MLRVTAALGCGSGWRDRLQHGHDKLLQTVWKQRKPRTKVQSQAVSSWQDLNLRAAYLRVVADAATSVLAILALVGSMIWGASWLDPVMGIVGATLVAVWARGLLRDSGRGLLDAEMKAPVVGEIREVIAASPIPARIDDLHVWRVGKNKYVCILGLSTAATAEPDYFRRQLSIHEELVHVTVELNSDQVQGPVVAI